MLCKLLVPHRGQGFNLSLGCVNRNGFSGLMVYGGIHYYGSGMDDTNDNYSNGSLSPDLSNDHDIDGPCCPQSVSWPLVPPLWCIFSLKQTISVM